MSADRAREWGCLLPQSWLLPPRAQLQFARGYLLAFRDLRKYIDMWLVYQVDVKYRGKNYVTRDGKRALTLDSRLISLDFPVFLTRAIGA